MESYLRNRKIDKICKCLSFGTIALLIVYMAVLTVLEKVSGTAAVMDFGYRSAVFIALWAVAAVSGLIHYFISAGHRAYAVSGIHIAFAFILAGALVTHLTGRQGSCTSGPEKSPGCSLTGIWRSAGFRFRSV